MPRMDYEGMANRILRRPQLSMPTATAGVDPTLPTTQTITAGGQRPGVGGTATGGAGVGGRRPNVGGTGRFNAGPGGPGSMGVRGPSLGGKPSPGGPGTTGTFGGAPGVPTPVASPFKGGLQQQLPPNVNNVAPVPINGGGLRAPGGGGFGGFGSNQQFTTQNGQVGTIGRGGNFQALGAHALGRYNAAQPPPVGNTLSVGPGQSNPNVGGSVSFTPGAVDINNDMISGQQPGGPGSYGGQQGTWGPGGFTPGGQTGPNQLTYAIGQGQPPGMGPMQWPGGTATPPPGPPFMQGPGGPMPGQFPINAQPMPQAPGGMPQGPMGWGQPPGMMSAGPFYPGQFVGPSMAGDMPPSGMTPPWAGSPNGGWGGAPMSPRPQLPYYGGGGGMPPWMGGGYGMQAPPQGLPPWMSGGAYGMPGMQSPPGMGMGGLPPWMSSMFGYR